MLETIIPKSEYDSIMVVLGEHKGQVSTGLSSQRDVCAQICAVITRLTHICLLRSAVFSSGTRTSAKRWSNSTDTRRKCSRWTMTAFVTMSEKQINDSSLIPLLYQTLFCNILKPSICTDFKALRFCNKTLSGKVIFTVMFTFISK